MGKDEDHGKASKTKKSLLRKGTGSPERSQNSIKVRSSDGRVKAAKKKKGFKGRGRSASAGNGPVT